MEAVAIDSAAIHAYEKKQPKRRSEQTGNANWGAKFDSFGNNSLETKSNGSATSSTLPWIRKVNFRWL